jgi:SPP1 gp7 family putative phage head morphogenesis protein
MTTEEFAAQLRIFLIRAEKGTALLLNYEFDQLLLEVEEYLRENPLADHSEIDKVLDLIRKKLATRTIRFASAVSNAQKRVINSAADATKRFTQLSSSIFRTDREAIKKLIGRTQDGGSLTNFFKRLDQPVREASKKALIEGFSKGEGADEIARRLRDAADIGRSRALTIARTETNEAYRAASREFYQEAAIKKYVWLAVLDARTCLICWALHGRQFNSDLKVTAHPNCRCTVVPVTRYSGSIETGLERFAKLPSGFQKQILGAKRFELFTNEQSIHSFVGSAKSGEFGLKHFIKPLEDPETE